MKNALNEVPRGSDQGKRWLHRNRVTYPANTLNQSTQRTVPGSFWEGGRVTATQRGR